jgi:hypothetical protein
MIIFAFAIVEVVEKICRRIDFTQQIHNLVKELSHYHLTWCSVFDTHIRPSTPCRSGFKSQKFQNGISFLWKNAICRTMRMHTLIL